MFCALVLAAPPEQPALLTLLGASRFDAVVLDGALDLTADPEGVVADGRSLLKEGGVLVALFSDTAGPVEIFDRAGCRVEQLDQVGDLQGGARYALLAKPKLRSAPRPEAFGGNARARIRELEQTALLDRVALHRLRSQLEADKIAEVTLHKLLDNQTEALADSRKKAAQTEDAWFALYAEAETLRAQLADLERALVSARDEELKQANRAQRMTAAESATNAWATQLQQKISELERQISEGSAYVKTLLSDIASRDEELERISAAAVAERAVAQEYAADLRERAEHVATTARSEAAAAANREREAREELARSTEALRETELRLGVEIRELRDRVADAEHALAAQTDAVIATMQAESAQISKLVDTVQSSRFWRFKRWLNRLLGGNRS